MRYEVKWEYAVDDEDGATTPLEAAEKAWAAVRAPGSLASCFTVTDEDGKVYSVDLLNAYSDAGRPEDLADLAPEIVRVLEMFADRLQRGKEVANTRG